MSQRVGGLYVLREGRGDVLVHRPRRFLFMVSFGLIAFICLFYISNCPRGESEGGEGSGVELCAGHGGLRKGRGDVLALYPLREFF